MSELKIEDIIEYVNSLCGVRKEIKDDKIKKTEIIKEYKEDKSYLTLFDAFFSSICSYFNVLNQIDKNFYIEKYKEFFIGEIKKKNNSVRYTTPTNIINKKKLMNDIKNIKVLEEKGNIKVYDDILIFLSVFFNINIIVIYEQLNKNILYTSNLTFNIFKPCITIKNQNNKFNLIYFNDELIYLYYKNDKFKSFIENNKFVSLKQLTNLDYEETEFIIKYDNDIEINEEIKEKIKQSNKRSKKQINQTSENKDNDKTDEKQEDKKETDNSNINISKESEKFKDCKKSDKSNLLSSKDSENLTEQIRQVMDITYTEDELKAMTLVKLKELAKQNKIRQSNPETKKPKSKAEFIKDLTAFYQQ